MNQQRPPGQMAGNGKFYQRRQKKTIYFNNNKADNFNRSDRTRERNPNSRFKECILLDEESKLSSDPKLHFNLVRNKSDTTIKTKPNIGGINGIHQNDKPSAPGTLRYHKMIDKYMIIDTIIPFMHRYKMDDAQNYIPLTSGCFVREIGDYYYCALCCQRERIDSRPLYVHIENQRHVDLFLGLRSTLRNMMPDSDSINMVALSYLTNTWLGQATLTDAQSEARMMAIGDCCTALTEVDSDCYCRIIGSFYSGSSLAKSDVNLELMHPNSKLFQQDPRAKDSIHHKLVDPDAEYGSQINHHTLHYDLISNAVDTLHKFAMILVQGYSSLRTLTVKSSIDDLNRKAPRLVLLHEPTQVTLEITCYAEANYRLACLLKNYLSMDQRALELSILVKHWAKLCRISNPRRGTLTPETFVILVIHFLQRIQPPVLPCLHELIGKDNDKKQKITEKSLAENLQNLDINDQQNCDEPLEVVEEDADYEDETTDQEFDPETIDKINWRSKNNYSTHELLIKFLLFSMDEFATLRSVISIRSLKNIKAVDRAWNTGIKAIENPVRPNVNMARNIGTTRTYEYIKQCFAHGYYYLTSMPMVAQNGLKRHREPLQHPSDYMKLFFNLKKFDFYFKMKESTIKIGSKEGLADEMIKQDLFGRDVEVIKELIDYFVLHNRDLHTIPVTVAMNFDTRMLTPQDVQATVFCWLCRSLGHERSNCPRKDALELNDNEFDPTLDLNVSLDHLFLKLYVEDMIDEKLAIEHAKVVQELADSICAFTSFDCELRLFGSTTNLLGSYDSDLDICMTLKDIPTGKGVDCVAILKATIECLKHNPNVPPDSIEPILFARVPIIKFKYGKFDVDLSMYNQCAIHNSMLLRAYVLIDSRTAQLFYLVKRYAKACGIADASRGSLSSYAWSLLVIHFLQHSSPPILPVLQETLGNQPKTVFGVNGWNVWFNQEADNKSMPPNDSNLTSLFKQFLFYYAKFDFNQYVVSIRTSRLLTKFQKNWTNCMIAIEDPFELTYNLSGRLDDPMALYIRNFFARTFRHLYKFQGNVLQSSQMPSLETIRSLFKGYAIMGSEPPLRGCRFCHRIGHRVKDCPERQRGIKAREAKMNEKEMRRITKGNRATDEQETNSK